MICLFLPFAILDRCHAHVGESWISTMTVSRIHLHTRTRCGSKLATDLCWKVSCQHAQLGSVPEPVTFVKENTTMFFSENEVDVTEATDRQIHVALSAPIKCNVLLPRRNFNLFRWMSLCIAPCRMRFIVLNVCSTLARCDAIDCVWTPVAGSMKHSLWLTVA